MDPAARHHRRATPVKGEAVRSPDGLTDERRERSSPGDGAAPGTAVHNRAAGTAHAARGGDGRPVTTTPSSPTARTAPTPATHDDDATTVAVLAAARGWPLYLRCHAFLLRPGRRLRGADRVAFYADRRVQPLVATVLGRREGVVVDAGALEAARSDDPALAAVLQVVLDDGGWPEESADVLLLSGPDDPATLDVGGVEHPRPTAWARTQRYVALGDLRRATTTEDLPAG